MLLAGNALGQAMDGDAAKLLTAAQENDFQTAVRLLAEGAGVDAVSPDGMTALHWAVYHDSKELASALIDAEAPVNLATKYGITPLVLAVENGNLSIIQQLARVGARMDVELPSGASLLMLAARVGRTECVQFLMEAGLDVNHCDNQKQNALMWASAEGHAGVVQVLLEAGADVKSSLPSGFNPLTFAAREGQLEVVQMLLKYGADVHYEMRPEKAVSKGVRRGMGPLLMAVENGHFELAMKLIQAGANPNDQRSGYTPLHTVTWVRKPNTGDSADGDPSPIGSGNLDSLTFVRRLVEAGADPNQRLTRGPAGKGKLNRTGATPFLMAAQTDDLPLMQLLLELGADPTIPNVDDCTPLLAAAGIGCIAPGEEAGTEDEAIECVQFLLELGADVNHVDKNGETAMHGAAYKSLPRVAELLVQRGARIDVWNRKNRNGWTPILIAEGHRVGNFKPSAETLAVLHQILIDAGMKPPPLTPRQQQLGYEQR